MNSITAYILRIIMYIDDLILTNKGYLSVSRLYKFSLFCELKENVCVGICWDYSTNVSQM